MVADTPARRDVGRQILEVFIGHIDQHDRIVARHVRPGQGQSQAMRKPGVDTLLIAQGQGPGIAATDRQQFVAGQDTDWMPATITG